MPSQTDPSAVASGIKEGNHERTVVQAERSREDGTRPFIGVNEMVNKLQINKACWQTRFSQKAEKGKYSAS